MKSKEELLLDLRRAKIYQLVLSNGITSLLSPLLFGERGSLVARLISARGGGRWGLICSWGCFEIEGDGELGK